MRPRVFPAEDPGGMRTASGWPLSFNEAAGIPRGRHQHEARRRVGDDAASMRPRVFPAEDRASSALGVSPKSVLQ